jgi:small multidrug resistance pump
MDKMFTPLILKPTFFTKTTSLNTVNSLNNFIPNNFIRDNFIIKPEYYLISSILLETLSTGFLKKTLINKIWFVPVYLGYGISFYIFPKALTKFSLSNAYTIWCGVGILLTTLIDTFIYKEIVTIKKIFGIITM